MSEEKQFAASADLSDVPAPSENRSKASILREQLAAAAAEKKAEKKIDRRVFKKNTIEVHDRLPKIPGTLMAMPKYKEGLDILIKYLNFITMSRSLSQRSLESYFYTNNHFLIYLLNEQDKGLLSIQSDDLVKYKRHLESKGIISIRASLNAIIAFMNWLHEEKIIEKRVRCKNIKVKAKEKNDSFVPTPIEIFTIRSSHKFNLMQVAYFELLLSSGMRRNESIQIRPCDIDFDVKVKDEETQLPSKYVGASITLDKTKILIKNRTSRKTYVSVFCAKILKAYMKKYGIDTSSKIQLFPIERSTAYGWVYHMFTRGPAYSLIRNRVIATNKDIKPLEQDKKVAEFLDIDENETANLSKSIKDFIKNRQKHSDNTFRGKGEKITLNETAKTDNKNARGFGPHCLRHLFASIMYWRTYNGETNNLIVVSKMLGHKSIVETQHYLRKVHIIDNEDDWKRLVLGANVDWYHQLSET